MQNKMKNALRKKCLEKRKNLKNTDLSKKITSLPEYKNAKTVFIYVSYESELITHSLIKEALKTKVVLVPLCINKSGDMIAVNIKSFDELKEGSYGILEPIHNEEFNGQIDFSVVPGVAFSKEGYRIGYGKGYYDRFLKNKNTFKLGICHNELLFDEIPFDEFDEKLDMIITPEREIRI